MTTRKIQKTAKPAAKANPLQIAHHIPLLAIEVAGVVADEISPYPPDRDPDDCSPDPQNETVVCTVAQVLAVALRADALSNPARPEAALPRDLKNAARILTRTAAAVRALAAR